MINENLETDEELAEFMAAMAASRAAKFSAYIKANPLPPAMLRGTLPTFWQTRIAMLEPSKPLKELTPKQMGQLGHLRVFYGEMARSVIAYAIDNWHRFASRAQSAVGLQSSPSEPHIGFLVTYHGIAGSMYLQSIAKPVQASPIGYGNAPIRYIAPPKEEPYKPTKEEIAADLAEFGVGG